MANDWAWLQNDEQRQLVTAAAMLVDALDKSGVFDARLELPKTIAPAVAALRSALADVGVVSVIEQGNVPAELARLGVLDLEPDSYKLDHHKVYPTAKPLPEQWKCPYCGYGEYRNRHDWEQRFADHLDGCDNNPRRAR
jgi:hypothetical protein